MNDQLNFLAIGWKKKVLKSERFLKEMSVMVPWKQLAVLVELHYADGRLGRKPFPLGLMLRIYCLQQWFGSSDPAAEEAIFAEIGTHLAQKGLTMKTGTIVDAPLIAAPSSTKNAAKKRDQQMSSTRKANQWHFGMEASVGVDAGSGLVHSVATTTASVHDSQVMQEVLHGEEKVILSEKGMPTTRANGKRGRAGFVGASWTKPNEGNPCRANSNRATGTGPACGRRSNTPFE